MRRRIRFALFAIILLAGAAVRGAADVDVVIMHTNDIRGHVLPERGSGGSAALATILRDIKPDLMVDAGNTLSGSLISDTFQGEPMIAVMNELGYDAAAVGQPELNFGLDALRDRAKQARFPLLSANTSIPIDEINPAAIYNAHGVRIAIIGLTTQETKGIPLSRALEEVDVLDVVQSAEKALIRVRDLVDFVVLLSRVTREEEIRLAQAFPEIKLIIGGHETAEADQPLRIGETIIVGAGRFGKSVGVIHLSFDEEHNFKGMRTSTIPTEGVSPDPEIDRLLAPYAATVAEKLQTVVGEATGDFTQSPEAESHVGNLVADALRSKTGTQIALTNAGRVRIGIPKGPITGQTLSEILPFEDTLIMMKLNGAQLKKILSRSFINVSGLQVKLRSARPEGRKLVSVRLANGKKLRDSELYTVATNHFLLAGGEGFEEFMEGRDIQNTGVLIRDAVAEHIARLGAIEPRLDGRLQLSR